VRGCREGAETIESIEPRKENRGLGKRQGRPASLMGLLGKEMFKRIKTGAVKKFEAEIGARRTRGVSKNKNGGGRNGWAEA